MAISSNMTRMLEVVPEDIHDRSGIFMGSEDEVKKVIKIFSKHAPYNTTLNGTSAATEEIRN